MDRARVILSEIDQRTRVPQADSLACGIVIKAWKGPIFDPTLVASEEEFIKYFGAPRVGDDNAYYSALAALQKTNKLWVVRAVDSITTKPHYGAIDVYVSGNSPAYVNKGTTADTDYDDDFSSYSFPTGAMFVIHAANAGAWNKDIKVAIQPGVADTNGVVRCKGEPNAFKISVYYLDTLVEEHIVSLMHQLDGYNEQMFLEDVLDSSLYIDGIVKSTYEDGVDVSAEDLIGSGAANHTTAGTYTYDSTTAAQGALDNTPIVAGSVEITLTGTEAGTIVDDEAGGLYGDTTNGTVSGTINYYTGAWSITFSADPGDDTIPDVDYTYMPQSEPTVGTATAQALFTGTLAGTSFSGSTTYTHIVPGSFKVYRDGVLVMDEDSDGVLDEVGSPSPALTGFVNYATGKWHIYPAAADENHVYTCSYNYYSGTDITVVASEAVANGDGTTTVAGTLDYTTVRSRSTGGATVFFYLDGYLVASDDGDGTLTARDGGHATHTYQSGSIDYSTGAVSLVFDGAVTSGMALTASYAYENGAVQEGVGIRLRRGDDGGTVSDTSINTGYTLLQNKDLYDVNVLLDGDHNTVSVHNNMITVCETRQDAVAILTTPSSDETDANYLNAILAYRQSELNANTSFATMFTPHLKITDKYNARQLYVAPDGYVGGKLCDVAERYEPWYSIAGYRRGNLIVDDTRVHWTSADLDALANAGINAIRWERGKGIHLMDQHTLLTRPSALDQLSVRMLLITIEPPIVTALEDFLFEINDEDTRRDIRTIINRRMANIKARRGVYDYLVVCDDTNNTADDIDNYILNVDLYVEPSKIIREIKFRVVIEKTGGIQSVMMSAA